MRRPSNVGSCIVPWVIANFLIFGLFSEWDDVRTLRERIISDIVPGRNGIEHGNDQSTAHLDFFLTERMRSAQPEWKSDIVPF